MDKMKTTPEGAQKLLKVAEDLRTLADSIQKVCVLFAESLPETKNEVPPELPAEPDITLEQVRGILADKSRSGKTAEVRAIIKKYGADRLSDIDPKDYPKVLKDAEVL